MKKLILVLFSSLLAAPVVSAAPTPVQLGRIRAVVPRNSSFSRVKYWIKPGPAFAAPMGLQNLTPEQLIALAKFLVPDPRNPPQNLPPALINRLMDVLAKVDMYYKRPIPKAEWDQRIKEMQDEFVKQNGPLSGASARSAEDWEKSIDGMIGGFVEKLGDPHSTYMNRVQAERFRQSMQSSFVGIGVDIEKVADGVKLEFVHPGLPAEKAGLIDDDVITAIDGVATKDQDMETIVGRIRGPAGTQVKIRVLRLGLPATVVRAAIAKRDLFGKMAAPGIGYVYFSEFGLTTDERLFAKIDALKASGATKLIIDLRGNGGGLLYIAESIGSEFLKDKDVITMTKRQGKLATTAITDGPGRYYGMPLAIIQNGGSASASELLAGGLQEHGKAIIVGSVSYGKASVQAPLETEIPVPDPFFGDSFQPDGTIIYVTEGGWYTPKDRSVEGVHDPKTERNIPGSGGVKPDVAVTMTEDEEKAVMKKVKRQPYGLSAGAVNDAALDKAIAVLNRR